MTMDVCDIRSARYFCFRDLVLGDEGVRQSLCVVTLMLIGVSLGVRVLETRADPLDDLLAVRLQGWRTGSSPGEWLPGQEWRAASNGESA